MRETFTFKPQIPGKNREIRNEQNLVLLWVLSSAFRYDGLANERLVEKLVPILREFCPSLWPFLVRLEIICRIAISRLLAQHASAACQTGSM